MDENAVIKYITDVIRAMQDGKNVTILNPTTANSKNSVEIQELLDVFNGFISIYNEGVKAIHSISRGELNFESPFANPIFEPLKNLQSQLKHLVWQTHKLAEGDYSQHINFLGDFSDSYNKLILSLRERQKLEHDLTEIEKKYKLITETTNDVIWILDIKKLKFKYISPSVFHLRGLTAEEAMNEPLGEAFYGDSYQRAMDKLNIALENSINNQHVNVLDEFKQRCKDGRIIDIEISASFIKDEAGNPIEILGVSRDITRRKEAETALKESQDQLIKLLARQTKKRKKLTRDLKYVFEHTTNAIAFFEIVDNQILFSLCNNRWANALGLEADKIIGMNINQLGDDETASLYRKYIHWAILENKPIEDITHWKDKELEIIVIPLKDDTDIISGCAAFVTDITEKQLAQQKMRNLEKQITFTGIQVETRERRKLASDLHDNVGPLLSSMNMYLSSLSRKPEIQIYADTLSDIRRILKETIASVREISNNISPQVLNSYGLSAALTLFFETKKNLITINIDNNMGDFRFSETKETMLYNIIKEAFNNSIKYANASSIDLCIKKIENLITLIYKDNGIGFNLEEKLASASQSLGLFSIINRIKNLDGIYDIKTSPGNGFMLEVNFLTN